MAPVPRGLDYKWVALINTTIGMFMSALDSSIVTIALPDIARSLGASVVEIMWVVMGFQLVVTSLQLPVSRLADMKGRVRIYNVGFALFTLASALCGLSQTGAQLVAFRLVQGAGAAVLSASGTALVTDAFPGRQRGFALSINQLAGITGFMLGAVLGGVLTQLLGWRYIFFINLPFGTFATAWAFLKLREITQPERKARFDVGGMVTFPLGIAGILGGLTLIVIGRAGDPLTTGLFGLGAGLLVVFALIERRVEHPMMDFTLFRIRIFWAGNTSLLLNALARGSTLFMMSWYFQAVLHDPPATAGLKILPMIASMMVLGPIAGRLSDRIGSRWLSTAGLVCTLVAQLWMLSFPLDVGYGSLAVALALLGSGNALFNAPNTSAVMGCVPPNRRGIAAGTRTLLMNSGQTAAIASAMVILSTVMSYGVLAGLFAGAEPGGASIDGLVFMRGLHEVFVFGSVMSVVAIICSGLRGDDVQRAVLQRPAALQAADQQPAKAG
jgi:EmrB/QacA subfamily drug resistance transporter